MTDRYELSIAPPARRALADRLPLKIAMAAWAFVDGPLRDNPHRVGHALRAPFEGHWSAHRGSYRVRYRIDEDEQAVIVLDIAPRADAYDPGRTSALAGREGWHLDPIGVGDPAHVAFGAEPPHGALDLGAGGTLGIDLTPARPAPGETAPGPHGRVHVSAW